MKDHPPAPNLRLVKFYERFEQGVILVLTALMMVVIIATLWKLILNIAGLLASEDISPSPIISPSRASSGRSSQ